MSDSFDFAAKVAEGFVFTPPGIEWNVVTPEGRHGAGPTPEDAIANVDSQLLYVDGKRVLIRADFTEVELDAGSLTPAPLADSVEGEAAADAAPAVEA